MMIMMMMMMMIMISIAVVHRPMPQAYDNTWA
jgi:hypothetical protein